MLPTDERWLQYLYERHSQTELAGWATSLRYFRFCRAYGGHANEGDQLKAALGFSSEDDLLHLLSALGLPVHRFPLDTPQPVAGHAYSSEQMRRFPSLVRQFPSIGQPGRVQVQGVPVFAWVQQNRLELDLSAADDAYAVDVATVRSAQRLESMLEKHAERIVDPPQDNRNCICPRYYPQFWREDDAL